MPGTCPYCSGSHAIEQCPRVQSVEYNPDGSVKKVELRDNAPSSLRDRLHAPEERLNLHR